MTNHNGINELLHLVENAPPALIAGGIIVLCLLLAVNAIRQSSRVQRVSRPELIHSGELAGWDRLANNRRMHR